MFDTDDGTKRGKYLNAGHDRLNKPAGIACDPENGDVYFADGYGNRRVVVFDKNGKFLRQWGRQATPEEMEAGVGGAFAEVVHSVAISNAGLVYVGDRQGDRVQVFDKHGKLQAQHLGAHGHARRCPTSAARRGGPHSHRTASRSTCT